MTTRCAGNADDSCCYVAGVPCRFLEEHTVPGRRWACGLYRELGSWARVHADPRYLTHVKPHWENSPLRGQDCGDWPAPGVTCPTCGVTGGG